MTERAGKPMAIVYVVSRADGWHKIGVTGDAAARCRTLSGLAPKHQRPLRLVREYPLGQLAPLIEKVAQYYMIAGGYEMHANEWFDAPSGPCKLAVRNAIRLIERIGPSGWQKRRLKHGMIEGVRQK